MLPQLTSFIALSLVIIVVPGPDLTLLLRNATTAGRRSAAATTAGVMTGNVIVATAAVAGLSAILSASAVAYLILKIAGAAYLIYLGIESLCSWRTMRKGVVADDGHTQAAARRVSLWAYFGQGLVTNVLNPKVAAFYLSLFPQFDLHPLNAVAQHTLLASIFCSLALLWYGLVLALLGTAEDFLQRQRVRRRVAALSGVSLISLGGFLLTRP